MQKQKISEKKMQLKKHLRSPLLESDQRVSVSPRHVQLVHSLESDAKSQCVFMVKVYAGLGAPGSELMTLSCVHEKSGREFEMRFDERYPISMRFKKLSDEERVESARLQIERAGGFEKAREHFVAVFGEGM